MFAAVSPPQQVMYSPSCYRGRISSVSTAASISSTLTRSYTGPSGYPLAAPVSLARFDSPVQSPARAAGFVPCDADASHAISVFEKHQAIVKTVKNDDWMLLIGNLYQCTTHSFRTSGALVPPRGVGMDLFGAVSKGVVGLVWDRTAIDISDSFMWPSGYNAKTEFNMKADGTLLNGRREALVSLKTLTQCNLERRYWHPYTSKGTSELIPLQKGRLPYNEVNFSVRHKHGIVAMVVRSMEPGALVFAYGLQCYLESVLGLQLPLLLCDVEQPVCAVPRQHLASVLRQVAADGVQLPFRGNPAPPMPPLDMARFPQFDAKARVRLHASCGITATSLRATFSEADGDSEVMDLLLYGLRQAVAAGNARAARELVRAALPLLSRAKHVAAEGCVHTTSLVQTALEEVRSLCMLDLKPAMLVPLGVLIVFFETCTGGVLTRDLQEAAKTEEWLEHARSFGFLIRNWHRNDPDSSLGALFSGKAEGVRRTFLCELQDLAQLSANSPAFFKHLHLMATELEGAECDRFRTFRAVLGLDSNFTSRLVHGVACLALDIVAPSQRSVFGVDEGNELEARSKLQNFAFAFSTFGTFDSDPVGHHDRNLRVSYSMAR